MANILITGASGFIGQHLVPELIAHNHRIIALNRSEESAASLKQVFPEIEQIRLGEIEADGFGYDLDAIVHLAGRAHVGTDTSQAAEDLMMAANADLTKVLTDFATRQNVCKFILLSSAMALSANTSTETISDQTIPRPDSTYGRSKLAAEAHVAEFAKQGGLGVSLRPPLVIGWDAKANWALLQRVAVLPIPLPLATIDNKRSFVGVDTLCAAIRHVVEGDWANDKSGAYCIAEDKAVSLAQTITALRRGMGRPARLWPVPAALFQLAGKVVGRQRMVQSLTGDFVVDPSRFFEAFGFAPSSTASAAVEASGRQYAAERSTARTSEPPAPTRLTVLAKRSFDFSAALAGTVALSPLIGLLVLWVRLDSAGPGLFSQTRVGRNEVPFTCYKLRTMTTETPNAPSHEVTKAALTGIGGLLRRTKLDELPQLWNIVRGDMSFVGPRPCLPAQTELIDERRRRGLYAIRPGITGVAQVAGVDMSEPARLAEVDARYLSTMSLTTDLMLISKTVTGSGQGDAIKPSQS